MLLHHHYARAGSASLVRSRRIVSQHLDLVVVSIRLNLQVRDIRRGHTILFYAKVGARTENTLRIILRLLLIMYLIIIIGPHAVANAEHLRGPLSKGCQVIISLCDRLL